MHILGLVTGLLVFVGVWWWRLKAAHQVATEIGDAAGQLRGAYRRSRFRQKVETSALAAIDDPRVAAAVLLVCIASEEKPLTEDKSARIATWLRTVAGVEETDELLVFARWAADRALGSVSAAGRLGPLWRRTLDEAQCQQLVDVAAELAADLEGPARADVLRKLRHELRLA